MIVMKKLNLIKDDGNKEKINKEKDENNSIGLGGSRCNEIDILGI